MFHKNFKNFTVNNYNIERINVNDGISANEIQENDDNTRKFLMYFRKNEISLNLKEEAFNKGIFYKIKNLENRLIGKIEIRSEKKVYHIRDYYLYDDKRIELFLIILDKYSSKDIEDIIIVIKDILFEEIKYLKRIKLLFPPYLEEQIRKFNSIKLSFEYNFFRINSRDFEEVCQFSYIKE
jgi:hypothetical protein